MPEIDRILHLQQLVTATRLEIKYHLITEPDSPQHKAAQVRLLSYLAEAAQIEYLLDMARLPPSSPN